jgi:hypothetical protein
MHLKIWPKYANIYKYMHIETETIESLCNDWYRFLKFHTIGVIKKKTLFHTLHKSL